MNVVTKTEAPLGSVPDTGVVEERLKAAITEREEHQAELKKIQGELDKLISTKKGPKKPREKLDELDTKIAKLEHARTARSLVLIEEKAILKQIHRLEKTKRDVQEYEAYDKQIKDRKVRVEELWVAIKSSGAAVSALRTEVSVHKSAEQLGCNVEDLLGMKLDCPQDKLGSVIGKKGSTVRNIMEKAKVNVNIDREDGNIRILGSHDALDNACEDLDRIIATVEQNVDAPAELIAYLTSKNIRALADLRAQHPNVNVSVQRSRTQVRIRGLAKDIAAAEKDLADLVITRKEISVPPSECMVIIGKQGSTIERLVMSHQTTIDVERKVDQDSIIVLAGPEASVETAVREIELMLSAAKEITQTVAVDPIVRATLLLKSGEGIKSLNKKVNAAVAEQNCFFGLSVSGDDIMIRGKAKAMQTALDIVEETTRELAASIVRVKVDPFAIPVFIGKGGKTMKKLKDGKAVNVELDRTVGEVAICGLDKSQVESVEEAFKAFAAEHVVERISVECSDLKSQLRDLLRSKAGKEISELVFPGLDEDKSEILLRGNAENVKKACELVNTFLAQNYTQEIELSADDMGTLLSGGKSGMVAQLSRELGIQLQSERGRGVIVAKGAADKVKAAVARIEQFLHGGDGLMVTKISLDAQLVGVVIGKKGKTKADLQQKFDKVSIVIHRDEHSVTLRGPQESTEDCRVEIMKLIAGARVTQTIAVTEKQKKDLDRSKAARRISQSLSVHISMTSDEIKVRGFAADVQHVVSLLQEQISGVYESSIVLEAPLFRTVSETCREPIHLQRIESTSGATISLDSKTEAVVLRGERVKVQLAKRELVKFLQFLISANFRVFEVPSPLLSSGSESLSLGDAAAISGATIQLDRDLNSLFVFSSESGRVDKAAEILGAKLQALEKLVFIMEFEASEDWLVSSIIGKSGVRIKSLRKELGCNVEVSSKERKVTVSAETEDVVANARTVLEKLVDDARRECAFVQLPEKEMSAFVGRSGSHITEFAKTHSVEVQVMKALRSTVRLTGDADAVLAAKAAVGDWVEAREQAKADAILAISLKKEQIPVILGSKGSVTRGLQDEFSCRIDIDRSNLTLAVSGGTAEGREGALNKIKLLLWADAATDDVLEQANEPSDEDKADPSDDAVRPRKQSHAEREKSRSPPEKKVERVSPPTFDAAIDAAADFPSLPVQKKTDKSVEESKSDEDDVDQPAAFSLNMADAEPPLGTGSSWAAIVTKDDPDDDDDADEGKAKSRSSFMSMVSDDEWGDVTSVCSQVSAGLVEELKEVARVQVATEIET